MASSIPTKPAGRLLNLGCGKRHHPDWVNMDMAADDPSVIVCDLSQGIPLPDGSCDAVYHSHVIEHLRRDDALPFLRECLRVLKPGGVLRVVAPDLEKICRLYLQKLDAAANGDVIAAKDYDWMMLELYDQTTREKSGGLMANFLKSPPPNEAFVRERIGQEAEGIISAARSEAKPRSLSKRILRKPRLIIDLLVEGLLRLTHGGSAGGAFSIGRFRMAGEIHQWMYDRWSLSVLMRKAGFEKPGVKTANNSAIPGWERYHLDTLEDGRTVKPDSIFIEATKPG